jgi:hypothetical protein
VRVEVGVIEIKMRGDIFCFFLLCFCCVISYESRIMIILFFIA